MHPDLLLHLGDAASRRIQKSLQQAHQEMSFLRTSTKLKFSKASTCEEQIGVRIAHISRILLFNFAKLKSFSVA